MSALARPTGMLRSKLLAITGTQKQPAPASVSSVPAGKGAKMRQSYHVELEALGLQAAQMCHLAGRNLVQATTALLHVDREMAEQVIASEMAMHQMRTDTEHVALNLLALQAPVAADLRLVVAAMWMVNDLDRMGKLGVHVAQAAARRHPHQVIPPAMKPLVSGISSAAAQLAEDTEEVLRTMDADRARELHARDVEIDDLHHQILRALLAPTWTAGVQAAVDLTMLTRFYERFADHAVAICGHVIFVVTGQTTLPATPHVPA